MKNRIRHSIFFFTIIYSQFSFAQFTHADTLRGSNGPGRSWWDVLQYNIWIKPNIDKQTMEGEVAMVFKTEISGDKNMQIDLQEPLMIEKVSFEKNNNVDFKKTGTNTWTIYLKDIEPTMYIDRAEGGKGVTTKDQIISINYHGQPKIALNPPWDGGLIWKKDERNRPWISIACQGLGASVWYPCKDYQGDEPDYGASLTVTTPNTLMVVGNGKLTSAKKVNDSISYTWEVKNPINNYNIIPYIGKYVNFSEVYKGEKGDLQMNYWVLDYNLEKAKKQFKQVPRMMKAFEYWFGPYPFYEDAYKLVESPHLGMEHQSAIAYGNDYQKGYKDRGDMSGTGWGLKWDFIIVHESAHEWFGNNITSKDIADMWIHESFANYSETLFTEYYYGKKAGSEYVIGTRKKILNDIAIIGKYGVNKEGSVDMYCKGGNMLHTIRQVINDDEKFRMILRGLNKEFYHQTVTTKQIEDYISKTSGKDLSKIFDQYLRTTMIPTLEYKIKGYDLSYRWTNVVKGFNMPIKINFKGQRWINPSEQWQTLKLYTEGKTNFSADNNFYIYSKKVK